MPKLTRDEMFQRAMAEFLQTVEVKLTNGEIKPFHIRSYTLTNKTENKTKFEHEYELVMPKDVVIAYRDITSHLESSEVVWEDSEPIYGIQELPSITEFTQSFNEYFNPYKLYLQHTLMSYVRILTPPTSTASANKTVQIKVVYHKTHTPFPRPLTELEEKENEINFLKAKIDSKTRKIITFRNILNRERDRAEHNYKRMQTKFRAMYAAENKYEDCPVCYDTIVPEKLIIPSCFHYICVSCVVKCESCPMCRDDYDRYIENDEPVHALV